MVAVSTVIGSLSAVPAIVSGLTSAFEAAAGLFGAGTTAVAAGASAPTFNPLSPGASIISSAAASPGTDVGPIIGQIPGTVLPAIIAAAPVVARAALPVVQRIAGPAAGATVQTAGGVRTVTRRQLILMQARAFSPGATAKKIVKAARDCGIEIAAATFGLGVLDVCFLVAQPPTRRSRGISAADMRRTRSTIRKVTTIQKQLKALGGPIRRR